jgi:CRP-like cAMP-binding protein
MLTPRQALERHPLFARLSPGVVTRVQALGVRRRWSAGATIFERGDPSGDMALLLSGRVRLAIGSAEGRELGIRHAVPGDLLGEIALLDGAPRTADAIAATPVEALALLRAGFLALMAEAPALAQAVIACLSARLRETTDQLEGLAQLRLEARLARCLLALAETVGSPSVRLAMTQAELADLLGARRRKVNAALGALESAGAVQRSGDGLLCHPALLREAAGQT